MSELPLQIGHDILGFIEGYGVQERQPWDDENPHGYLESDDEYIERNLELVIHLLDYLNGLKKEGVKIL